ncbi:MAG: hypothetical protein WDZ45_12160 [Flavobacteriaceae bacterium]
MKNKNGNTLLNKIDQNLFHQREEREIELKNNHPDLYKSYVDSINEYASDHLENFIKFDLPAFLSEYSESQLETFFTELAAYRAFSKAKNNFSNSRLFLEYAYDLNKYYTKYTLNFDDQNSNPLKSKVFDKMKKERFPDSKPEPGIYLEREEIKPDKKKHQVILTEKEKYYLSFILFELLQAHSPMNKVEFMKIIVLTQNTFDESILKTKTPANLTSYKNLNELDKNFSHKIEFLSELKVKVGAFKLREVQAVIGSKITKLKNSK